jgi:hypothetical protein
MSDGAGALRALNVVLGPGSEAHRHAAHPHATNGSHARSANLADGFSPRPSWNLVDNGGRTIADLTFVNRYVGPGGAWAADDMQNIDHALSAAMSDPGLQSVIAQYFDGHGVTSTMLPSAAFETALPDTVHKDEAESLARQLHDVGVLGDADPANCVINILLPRGTILSDDFSPGFRPSPEEAERHDRRRKGVIKIDPDDAASSKEGLGGYHGSIHLEDDQRCYYAVGVYSEGDNGIPAFDQPWKSVVATFYHELNEARTDAAVEDVNATGDGHLLGWYSQTGEGEIGDLPINEAQDIGLVFKEVPLSDGSGTVPIQLMWSNAADGPAARA